MSSLVHVAFGFTLWWIFLGWNVIRDLQTMRRPKDLGRGGAAFVHGQAMALLLLLGGPGLAGLGLQLPVFHLELAAVVVAMLALLYAAEAAHLLSSRSEEPHPISGSTFASGRNLVLRSSSPLAMAVILLVSVQDPVVVRLQLAGIALGWASGVLAWSAAPLAGVHRPLRLMLGVMALVSSLVFALTAWNLR